MKKNSLSFMVTIGIGIAVFLSVLTLLIQTQSMYVRFDFWDRFPSLKNAYGASQYVIKNPVGWIPDEVVNAYAGAEYIKYGVSPILIAADTPPFGRYLIGLSALLFNNENLFILISGIGSLILLYLIGRKIFKSKIFALIPVLLVSLEPIFRNQFVYVPLLDIMQLFFLLLTFYFFILGREDTRSMVRTFILFCLSSLFFGMFISTKFYATGVTIVAALGIVLLLHKEFKKLVLLVISLPISVVFLLLNYVQLLFQGYTIREFLGVQEYVLEYHKSQLIKPFTIWPLLILNRWHVWWGNVPILSDPQWRITWPILTLSLVGVFFGYITKFLPKNKNVEPLLSWAVIYILFFSLGQITARYLVILIPVMYIVFFYGVEKLWERYKKNI